MIPSPPKKLMLGDVPRYIRTHYGHDVTKPTIYNWAKNGRNGRLLKTVAGTIRNPVGGPKVKTVTTTQWVDEFLHEVTDFR